MDLDLKGRPARRRRAGPCAGSPRAGAGLRKAATGDAGFTLVELLVVMLILAVLAAVAIPAFFSQRDKARDADAKSVLAAAQVALETYSTDNDGTYLGADIDALVEIEPTLTGTPMTIEDLGQRAYTIQLVSDDGQTFRIERTPETGVLRTCTPPGTGGCPSSGQF